jgi:hypothetical protein
MELQLSHKLVSEPAQSATTLRRRSSMVVFAAIKRSLPLDSDALERLRIR